MYKFIHNIGEYFSTNYFDEDFIKKVEDKSGYAREDIKEFQKQINRLKDPYFKYKQTLLEDGLRTKDIITETHHFHTRFLRALGYEAVHTDYDNLYPVDEDTVLPVRHTLYRGEQPHLMIMEMQPLIGEGDEEPDGLFEQQYHTDSDESAASPQKYHRSQWANVFKVPEGVRISPMIINKAVSTLFLLDPHRRPRYILLCAGNVYYLLEQEKWFRGSYLEFDLEMLFDEASVERGYYSLFYFLLAKETLAPQSEIVLMEQLDEDSHKGAYEVTKDLKEGVIHAVEAIANEAVHYLRSEGESVKDLDAGLLKEECLTYVYRLLFLFYAESRADLGILPADDDIYQQGYSLEMLRDLEQVPLNTASSREGYFFHESLSQLFGLLSNGYRENNGDNRSFQIRHLDSPLFDDEALEILPRVKLRNQVWQHIISQLSLSRKQRGRARGRISYANLGINQLGSVYESLLAFRGFFAEEDYIEVHRKPKNQRETSASIADKDGSFLVPRRRLDDFKIREVYHEEDGTMRIISEGTFIYRLSGRDRQRSASYYTPEVLTETTVKYTLKPILERLDRGEIKALDLLKLKILEPAMGAAAFHNEVINQLAEAYLQYRQEELKKKVSPDHYQEERQKVKAYIALNNVYGVDLNPTAVELGKLSLWLNVIHKDMQTPFFGYRLGTGNAVVGAWLKVFRTRHFLFDPKKPRARKKWWDRAPKHLDFSSRGIRRKSDEIYHFLLPDKGMVSSAGIQLLKKEYPEKADYVRNWKKEFCEPIRRDELQVLERLSREVDRLLEEHYQHQRVINHQTSGMTEGVFGAEVPELSLSSYEAKKKLADQRHHVHAPYHKLKMIMDYWCSLWYWDVREAEHLPTRSQWWHDLSNILRIDLEAIEKETKPYKAKSGFERTGPQQSELFQRSNQLVFGEDEGMEAADLIARYGQQHGVELYDNQRLSLVRECSKQYLFFHYQLEFIEVFRERSGFDIAVGNPPWIKVLFEEKGLMSEVFPELEIRGTTAPQVRKLQENFLDVPSQKNVYFAEYIETESSAVFMNGNQNYPLLKGQQNNLYKCILENGFHWISQEGYLGLIHPEGVYNDPSGQSLRKEMYQRLKYHFQFKNSLMLFSEIRDQKLYSINIYNGEKNKPDFNSISNLFHPSTIDLSYINKGEGECPSLKKYDKSKKKYTWDLNGHSDRIIKIDQKILEIVSALFEDSDKWESIKLPSFHSIKITSIVQKLAAFNSRIYNYEVKMTVCWDETNDVRDGSIKRETKTPIYNDYEMIYSGPHIFTSTSFYKTPRRHCSEKSHYDVINMELMDSDYLPRTNYIPILSQENLINNQLTFDNKPWIEQYKLAFRKMLNHTADRTLNGGIIPPKTSHINGIISLVFPDLVDLVECYGISCSIFNDLFIKLTKSANLTESRIKFFPLGIAEKFKNELIPRALILSCMTSHYSDLWSEVYKSYNKKISWAKRDNRLKDISRLPKKFDFDFSLKNPFERRQALIEIDVIVAMAMGLTLSELLISYQVEFPKFNEYEDDTVYDTTGNIVYTSNNQGLVGVGVDKKTLKNIKDMKAGETYEHTITKSELYEGEKVIYYAPFDKCDRVEDYKVTWAHFEEIFNPSEILTT